MDGTLTKPNLDLELMYSRCGIDRGTDILKAVELMEVSEAQRVTTIILEMEAEAASTLELADGAAAAARFLCAAGVPIALVTRNSAATVTMFEPE